MIKPGDRLKFTAGSLLVVDVVSRVETREGLMRGTWYLALMIREDAFDPFVVSEFMEGDREWNHGDYYSNLRSALGGFWSRSDRTGYTSR